MELARDDDPIPPMDDDDQEQPPAPTRLMQRHDGALQLQHSEQKVVTTFQGTNRRPVPGTSRYVMERVTLPSYATAYKVTVEYTIPPVHPQGA